MRCNAASLYFKLIVMNNHANAIAGILREFADELKINHAYFHIDDVKVSPITNGKITFSLANSSELENKKVREIEDLKAKLYTRVQDYMHKHCINDYVTISTMYRG